MSSNGLTLFAWTFMLVSMISVTVLVAWCFYRILNSKGEFGGDRAVQTPSPGRADIT